MTTFVSAYNLIKDKLHVTPQLIQFKKCIQNLIIKIQFNKNYKLLLLFNNYKLEL